MTPVLEKPYINVSINPENIKFCHFTNGGHTRKSIMTAPMFSRIKRSIHREYFLRAYYIWMCSFCLLFQISEIYTHLYIFPRNKDTLKSRLLCTTLGIIPCPTSTTRRWFSFHQFIYNFLDIILDLPMKKFWYLLLMLIIYSAFPNFFWI